MRKSVYIIYSSNVSSRKERNRNNITLYKNIQKVGLQKAILTRKNCGELKGPHEDKTNKRDALTNEAMEHALVCENNGKEQDKDVCFVLNVACFYESSMR